ncbi:glycine--tRNA ligase, mitochondrial 1-like protein [Tanacetum coccineum]
MYIGISSILNGQPGDIGPLTSADLTGLLSEGSRLLRVTYQATRSLGQDCDSSDERGSCERVRKVVRVYLFLAGLVIDEERLRSRQHLPNEMAHYDTDGLDAEIESSYGLQTDLYATCVHTRAERIIDAEHISSWESALKL